MADQENRPKVAPKGEERTSAMEAKASIGTVCDTTQERQICDYRALERGWFEV
ncbi:MAG: hypothetical protein BMS9Abin12_0836 [Acidimicrobiia bacterium]|nr:MAG: hypothetical protein BMS9Abin12_0836 [Acidimicrobiia bacterium]